MALATHSKKATSCSDNHIAAIALAIVVSSCQFDDVVTCAATGKVTSLDALMVLQAWQFDRIVTMAVYNPTKV